MARRKKQAWSLLLQMANPRARLTTVFPWLCSPQSEPRAPSQTLGLPC